MYWANLLHIYQPPGQRKRIIEKVVRESYLPILDILEVRSNVKLSLNICASLTEQLVDYGFEEALVRIKNLAEKGQIELVGSAKYHPILPLLPKREVIRQIKLNENLNQKYFKNSWRPRPRGFFLPELAYDKKTARIIQSLGYEWIVLDEIVYPPPFDDKMLRIFEKNVSPKGGGRITNRQEVRFDRDYQIKDLFPGQSKKPLKVIFRNRGISNLFFGKWLDSVEKFFYALKRDKCSDKFLVTAFDGENLGHHRKHLIRIWQEILDRPEVESITYSEYLNHVKVEPLHEVEPLASSWSTEARDLEKGIPYPLWAHPENELHKLQWQLTNLMVKSIKGCEPDPDFKKARKLLDKALASDQYWWASARPWWNPGIIERGAKRFVEVVELLKNSLPSEIKNKAGELAQKIFNELERRKKSGHYKIIEKISDWK